MMRVREVRLRRGRGERGSALVLALLFLTVCGVTMGGLLTFSSTSSVSTSALRTSRGNDYDVEAAMQAAIATVRIGLTCPSFTPPWALNNPSRPLRVDCRTLSSSSGAAGQRNDVLTVCPGSVLTVPCPDGSSLLRVNVVFYDTFGNTGSSLVIQTWSNQ
jgi:hypothetical protein